MGAKSAGDRKPRRRKIRSVLQFLVVLTNTSPLVWRRIQVPADYSFWDLHVAIQDAVGWLDYHLHEFRLLHPERRCLDLVGIPDEDFPEERPCAAGWEVNIAEYFSYRSSSNTPPAVYVYDFGDDWIHVVMFEDELPVEESVSYPRCVAGARACPPEDCGGVHGYAEFLQVIADTAHPDHSGMLEWSGGAYDTDAFEPSDVHFDDPRKRWKAAFQA